MYYHFCFITFALITTSYSNPLTKFCLCILFRYIAICHPLRRPEMCTAYRAKIVVIFLLVIASVGYSCSLWTSTVTVFKGKCCLSFFHWEEAFVDLFLPLLPNCGSHQWQLIAMSTNKVLKNLIISDSSRFSCNSGIVFLLMPFHHGSHIFRLTNFPDFPWLFQYFLSIFQNFSVLYVMELKNTKIYLTNTLQFKSQRKKKKKNWPKFPHFSSILGEILWLFQSVQNSLTFPWLEKFPHFSRFSSPCGNHVSCHEYFSCTLSKISSNRYFLLIIHHWE